MGEPLRFLAVVLIRFPSHSRESLARSMVQVVREQGDRLQGAFVIVQAGMTRISQQPG